MSRLGFGTILLGFLLVLALAGFVMLAISTMGLEIIDGQLFRAEPVRQRCAD